MGPPRALLDKSDDCDEKKCDIEDEKKDEKNCEKDSFAAVNARNRQMAFAWISKRPLGKLVLARLVMEPLRHLLGSQFRVSGADWAKQK